MKGLEERRSQNPLCSLRSVAETPQAFEHSGKESGSARIEGAAAFLIAGLTEMIQRWLAGLAVAAVMSAEICDREASSLTLDIACLSTGSANRP